MVSETIQGVIVGGILGLISGIVLTWLGKFFEEKSARKYILGALLSEVELNQRLLQNDVKLGESLRKFVENPESFPAETIDMLKNNITENGYNVDIPKNKKFDRTFYSDVSYKLGLLNLKIRNNIVTYYGELKEMEFILESLSEISFTSGTTSDVAAIMNSRMKHAMKEQRTKYYFEKAEECFKKGDQLIEQLKTELK